MKNDLDQRPELSFWLSRIKATKFFVKRHCLLNSKPDVTLTHVHPAEGPTLSSDDETLKETTPSCREPGSPETTVPKTEPKPKKTKLGHLLCMATQMVCVSQHHGERHDKFPTHWNCSPSPGISAVDLTPSAMASIFTVGMLVPDVELGLEPPDCDFRLTNCSKIYISVRTHKTVFSALRQQKSPNFVFGETMIIKHAVTAVTHIQLG